MKKEIWCVLVAGLIVIQFCKKNDLDEENSDANSTSGQVVVSANANSLQVTEGATIDSYSISLSAKPKSTISILVIYDEDQLLVTPNMLFFTPDDYNSPKTLTVTPVDDEALEGPHNSLIEHKVVAGDSSYRKQAVAGAFVSITDNDSAGLVVGESNNSTVVSEKGQSDSYAIWLTTAPKSPVIVTINTVSADIVISPNPPTFTFDSSNYNIPQNVMVGAVVDNLVETTYDANNDPIYETAAITYSMLTADSDYTAYTPPTTTVEIIDANNIIYVDVDAPDGGNGFSWATAYNDLAQAIDNAVGNQHIWIAEGTYKPNISDRSRSFRIDEANISLYGGFNGTEVDRSERVTNNETILSGDIGAGGNHSDNSYHVVEVINVSPLLDLVTIEYGNANGSSDDSLGGGIFAENSSLSITNVKIRNNQSANHGAGLHCDNCDNGQIINSEFLANTTAGNGGAARILSAENFRIQDCTLDQNTAANGGGIYLGSNSNNVILDNNIWKNNSAAAGGAIYFSPFNSNLTIQNGRFDENQATVSDGGAIYYAKDNLTIENVNFNKNEAEIYGGAIFYLANNGGHSIIDSNFAENTSNNEGGAVFLAQNIQLSLTNVNFSENTATNNAGALYLGVNSTLNYGTGTLSQNMAADGAALFQVDGSTLNLVHLTFTGNAASDEGAGVYTGDNANLNLHNSTFTTNTAYVGAGFFSGTDSIVNIDNANFENNGADGGVAIYSKGETNIFHSLFQDNTGTALAGGAIRGKEGNLNISYSSFINNSTINYGGAISGGDASFSVNIRIFHSYFYDNQVFDPTATGGAVYFRNGGLRISDSVLENNQANRGAGLYAASGSATVTVINSALTSNQTTNATNAGAGIYVSTNANVNVVDSIIDSNQAADGAGIYNNKGNLTLKRSQVVNNSASNTGGGVYSLNGTSTITSTLIAHNQGYTAGLHAIALCEETNTVTLNTVSLVNNIGSNNGGYYGIGANIGCTINGQNILNGTGAIFWGNSGANLNSFDNFTQFLGTNNCQNCHVGFIDPDPLFINESLFDFRLNLTSPVSDVINPPASGTDLLGVNRGFNGSTDKGAYEFTNFFSEHITLTLDEASSSEINNFNLLASPGSDMSFNLTYDSSRITADATSLDFNAGNYSVPQPISFIGINNCDWQPASAKVPVSIKGSASNPPPYDGVVSSFVITINDNDTKNTPCVRISESSANTAISLAGTDSIWVGLTAAPVADVMVTLTPDTQIDLNGLVQTPLILTFTNSNWVKQQVDISSSGSATVGTGYINYTTSSTDTSFDALTISATKVDITP